MDAMRTLVNAPPWTHTALELQRAAAVEQAGRTASDALQGRLASEFYSQL